MRILFIANNDIGLYKFRKELIEKLLLDHEVHICLPYGEYIEDMIAMGCVFHRYEFNRHGTNLFAEVRQVMYYRNLLKIINPDVVLSYTIKPNIYGGMACASLNIPYISNITGLGSAVENGGMMQKVLMILYKYGLRKARMVFFQNKSNCDFMLSRGIIKTKYEIIPGSGVNLEEHISEPYPEESERLVFVNIGRIMKDKGSDEILYAAKTIRKDYPNVVFKIIGGFDGDYESKVSDAVKAGDIEFLGQQTDIHSFIKESHAIVHASYSEGMSNVLLEAAACARPIIATDVPGCREIYDDGVSGISCKARNGEDLVRAIRDFIELSYDEKKKMGLSGRQKIEKCFDRNIVVNRYIEEINKIK